MALSLATAAIPTHDVPLVDGKYHCPECNNLYDQRKGLASHRRKEHNIKGTSSSTLFLEKLKAQHQGAQKAEGQTTLPFAPVMKKPNGSKSPKQAKPAKQSKRDFPRQAKKVKGGLICEICQETGFKTPAHLGRHRRFDHGIEGTAHMSVKRRKALIELSATPVKRGRPVGSGKASNVIYPCQVPGCTHKPFKTRGRLTNHMNQVHQDLALPSTDLVHIPQENLQTLAKAKGHKHGSNGNHHHLPEELDTLTRTILPEVYADTVGQIKGWLFSLAAQNDIPPQHFASRVIRDLYSTTRRT